MVFLTSVYLFLGSTIVVLTSLCLLELNEIAGPGYVLTAGSQNNHPRGHSGGGAPPKQSIDRSGQYPHPPSKPSSRQGKPRTALSTSPPGALRSLTERYGALRSLRAPHGALRSFTQPHGASWSLMEPYGASRSLMEHCGTLQSLRSLCF